MPKRLIKAINNQEYLSTSLKFSLELRKIYSIEIKIFFKVCYLPNNCLDESKIKSICIKR